jgi:hypothetical protein
VANKDIKRATLEYCADNLRNREPDPEVKELVELRKALYELKVNEEPNEVLEISKDDFEAVVKKFKSKQTKSYDFLIKASQNFQDAIHYLCARMIKNEEFPQMFRKTLLYMIWKSKGPQEILKNRA